MQFDLPLGQETKVSRGNRAARQLGSLRNRWLGKLGRWAENVLAHVGELATIVWSAIRSIFTGQIGIRQVVREMHWMGVQSLPIITVTGLLSGIVTSQQGGYQFTGSVPL